MTVEEIRNKELNFPKMNSKKSQIKSIYLKVYDFCIDTKKISYIQTCMSNMNMTYGFYI